MVNADATAASMTRHYGVHPSMLTTVHLCVEPDAPTAGEAEPLAGDPALLFSGANFYRKGLDVAVRSLVDVRAQAPGVHLHVAGHAKSRGRIESAC